MPKLYCDVPAGAKFKVIETGEVLYKYYNLQGLYAYCENENGERVEFPAWQEVEIVE